MASANDLIKVSRKSETRCAHCPLRTLATFRAFTAEELHFIETFKIGEARIAAGRPIMLEGESSPHLYTVLSGWAIKHKSLDDGRRQIINFALAGDLLGLQGAVFEKMQHTVEALSDVVLCVFPRDKLWSLYQSHQGLGYDLTWIAANEKTILAEFLVTVGQRTATERIAFLLLTLFRRAREVGLVRGKSIAFPFTQADVADTIGFSLVHTNKSLNRLRRTGTFAWAGQHFTMLDEAKLAALAVWPDNARGPRPFI